MKRKSKILLAITVLTTLSVATAIGNKALATEYTASEVATHNTANDCWAIFEDKVYDITNCVELHYRYMDIENWCGEDMTDDFISKAGEGVDHRTGSYQMLYDYYLGDLITSQPQSTDTSNTTDTGDTTTETDMSQVKNPYNFVLPFSIAFGVYLIFWGLLEAKKLSLPAFNFIWNTVLIIAAIPCVMFGFYMIAGYSFRVLRDVNFDFLYWHVEGSIVFGTIVVMHLIRRFKPYIAPLQLLKQRAPNG